MKAVIQRVKQAAVRIGEKQIAGISQGAVILAGVQKGDTETTARALADKIYHLRIFDDPDGKMNCPIAEIGGSFLVISQFTLLGDCRKGRRPSFTESEEPAKARAVYEAFIAALKGCGVSVSEGAFQETMLVEIHNDGPVTFVIEARNGSIL
ncbi:MAG: D-tyrosyl-tRNA(Tyr) deacylase [Candidatus Omnitrophica bacterium]|nr:D-tyrosyl-tRNA(Tyr) deacylase [Candidatus Omnitrophota bacterium]